MNTKLIEEIAKSSHDGKINFLQQVEKLEAEGLEAYYVDLVRGEWRYYMTSGESHIIKTHEDFPQATEKFTAEQIQQALRQVQTKQINYGQFLGQILRAGCPAYAVYIKGRQVIYFGRRGEMHIEKMPPLAS